MSVPKPAYTYPEFRALVGLLAAERRTTGPEQLPFYIRLTAQNQDHLDRLYAAPLRPALVARLRQLPRPQQWLVLAEAWCPDTAFALPVLAHLAAESQGQVSLHVLLRSEHPGLMAAYQTNGKNSIPKLIRRDAETGQDQGTWGPRPEAVRELSDRLHNDKDLPINQVAKGMSDWYEADNGQELQRELLAQLA